MSASKLVSILSHIRQHLFAVHFPMFTNDKKPGASR